MLRIREGWPALAFAGVLTACGPSLAPAADGWGESANSFGTRSDAGATVLTAAQLLGGGGSLLEAMVGRLGTMRVTRQGRCPQITFRGHRSIVAPSAPAVYVDGTRAANTCVLDQIRSSDVRRVEVYPGVTGPRGYRPSPHGTVIVHLGGSTTR
jgi:hypothetical protein